MRIGVTGDVGGPGVTYRADDPLTEMARRGHTVVWPTGVNGRHDYQDLVTCDVLHVYRLYSPKTRKVTRALRSQGVAFTWDNDDDYSAPLDGCAAHLELGHEKMAEIFRESVATAKLSQIATFPSAQLAKIYRGQGVKRVEVIENAVRTTTTRRAHDGIVIGWIAAAEHAVEVQHLELSASLRRLQAAHPQVHVEAIGVDLGLTERYTHTPFVPFDELPDRIAGFDIGIAPLADLPFNHSRSNIKIKEYAAAGVPWLASPLPPYLPHSEGHGGRLIADDGWFEALDELVRTPELLRRLNAEAAAWGESQRITTLGDQWEAVFERAVATLRARR